MTEDARCDHSVLETAMVEQEMGAPSPTGSPHMSRDCDMTTGAQSSRK